MKRTKFRLQVAQKRIRELEKELVKKEADIEFLRNSNERKDDELERYRHFARAYPLQWEQFKKFESEGDK